LEGNWYLSTGTNPQKQIAWLRAGAQMPHPDHFEPLPPIGSVVYGTIPLDDRLVFYPELFYHGLRVWPKFWRPDTREPILQCDAIPEDGSLDDAYFARTVERSTSDHRGDPLLADGWQRWDKFAYDKDIHVDELDKIAGPPPIGPC
jgi:hypothetical protein